MPPLTTSDDSSPGITGNSKHQSPLGIDQLITKFGLPQGYKRLPWNEATSGQEVYLWSQHDGKPRPVGPHTVASVKNRYLQNKKGWKFRQYSEDLLVAVTPAKN